MDTTPSTTDPDGSGEAAPSSVPLSGLGWDDGWDAALAASPPGFEPGRISRIDRGELTVLSARGPLRVRASREVQLAVGDWITVSPEAVADGLHEVGSLLPRRTAFTRTARGGRQAEQVVAANVDTVLIVTAVDRPLTVGQLERYVALAWHSGADPVVAITKADLASADQLHDLVEVITATAPEVPIHAISTATGLGMEAVDGYLTPGRTVALVGLSGAGKSTLVNALAKVVVLTTGEVRSDGQGRHTTTYRELVVLPGGGLIIDTPGMRTLSVGAAEEGVRLAFADVEALAADCEFDDCSHQAERGCALRAAVAAERLTATRLSDWLALAAGAAPDHSAGRQQVLVRKRRKADAKTARRLRHQEQAPAGPAPITATHSSEPSDVE